MFKNLKLATKLILGIGTPLFLMVVLAVFTFAVTDNVKKNAQHAQDKSKESFDLSVVAQRMKLDVVQVQQWLSDISATRALDGLDDGFDEAENSRKSFFEGMGKFKNFYSKENDTKGLQTLAEMEKAMEDYFEEGNKMATGYVTGGPAVGNKLMANFDEAAQDIADKIDPFVKEQGLAGEEALESIKHSIAALQNGVLIGIIACVIICFIFGWFIIRSITKPINRVIEGLGNGADQVASASEQLSSSSQQMSEGASEQASSLEEVSSSLEEMSSMTKQNAENAKQANIMSSDAGTAAQQGKDAMGRMSDAIDKIKTSSDETAKIVKTIDEIAMQTNLLALNAAVEAARAGEAGRGFAVVAEEVRNLAQRSAEAAKTTAELIEGAQKNSENGVNASTEVGKILEQIIESIQKVAQLIAEVSAASDEQSQGIDQVNTAVAQMDKVTQNNAANSEESASASEELSSQAQNLNAMVFKLTSIVGGNVARNNRETNGNAIVDTNRNGILDSVKTVRPGTFDNANALHYHKGNGEKDKKIARADTYGARPEMVIPFENDKDLKEF